MHQPGYYSVVFGVLGDFGDARQAVGWRKMKISTDRNTSVYIQLKLLTLLNGALPKAQSY